MNIGVDQLFQIQVSTVFLPGYNYIRISLFGFVRFSNKQQVIFYRQLLRSKRGRRRKRWRKRRRFYSKRNVVKESQHGLHVRQTHIELRETTMRIYCCQIFLSLSHFFLVFHLSPSLSLSFSFLRHSKKKKRVGLISMIILR